MVKATFLNVDLELRSRAGLPKLLEAFGRKVYVLNKRRGFAAVEVSFGSPTGTIDQTIQLYYRLFRSLPPAARRLWNQCQDRSFNIGIDAGTRPDEPYGEFPLSKKSLTRLNEMKGRLVITVYSPYEDKT